MTASPLDGLKVVELGTWVSAPLLGKYLAGFGAEVIKVEPPEGDPARRLGPFPGDLPHLEKSGMFLYLNTSKLGVTLDLHTNAGMQILLALVQEADILIENNPPALMEELGLTYDRLQQSNPGLVMTSITPFGQTGPYRDYHSSPLVSYALSGVCYDTPAGGVGPEKLESYPPVRGWGWQLAFMAAFNAAWATMAALFDREVTGNGRHVDATEMESGAATLRTHVPEAYYTQQAPGWSKARRAGGQGAAIYPTKDGYVNIGAFDDHQWARWMQVMGNPDWSKEERFATMAGRRDNRALLHAHVSEWTRQHSKNDITNWIQEALTIAFPVYTPREVVEDEHNRAREIFVEHEHPVAGQVQFPGAPFQLSGTPWNREGPAPQLGEHNEMVLCGRLGYRPEDLVHLRNAGAI